MVLTPQMGKLHSRYYAAREAWRHPRLGKILLGIGTVLVIFWVFRTPQPNYSIIVMAVAAGLMALRPDMSGSEKWLWAFMLTAFAVVEVRAIRNDRAIHDAEQARAAKEQADHFQSIADGITRSIATSDRHFDDTMSGVRSVIALETAVSTATNNSLEQITGGGAYCFLVPTQIDMSGTFELAVATSGKVMLPSCDVRIVENAEPGDKPEDSIREFFMPGLNLTRIQPLPTGATLTGYRIQAAPHRSYQMILRSPTRQVREDMSFAELPTHPGFYVPTCKIYSFEAKPVLLKDGCDNNGVMRVNPQLNPR